MKNTFQIVAIAVAFVGAAGAGLIGCGDGDDEDMAGDGGRDGGGITLYALKSGDYVIQSATDVTDGCDIGVNKTMAMGGLIGVTLPLVMEMSGGVNTGKLTLGSIQGMPAQPSIGTGNISSNEGTLTSDTTIMAPMPSMCSYKRQTSANMKMIDNYKFTLKTTRTHSNLLMCTTTATCTSTWTWTLSCPTCSTGGAGSDAGR